MGWREKLQLVSDVLAIGRAYDDGRITPAQASEAIIRVGREADAQPAPVAVPVGPEHDLVGVR